MKQFLSLSALVALLISCASCTAAPSASDGEEVARSESALDTGFGLPFPAGAAYTITQSPQNAFSHVPPYNTYAVDFAMPVGAAVVASGAGSIVSEGWFYGEIRVLIDHGGNRCTLYTHLNRTVINVGDWVQRGQYIGDSGATGNITGPHLHWDMVNCSDWTSREIVPTEELGTNYPTGTLAVSNNYQR
jgi:murein DD-endopeptidase MepM/ murein hydrolase activator NlpD